MRMSSLWSALWILVLIGLSVAAGVQVEQHAEVIVKSVALPAFLATPLETQAEMSIIRVLAGIIGGFLTFFGLAYLLPAVVDAVRLAGVVHTLGEEAEKRLREGQLPPVQWRWSYYPGFTHLWREYARGLLLLPAETGDGAQPSARYQAGFPAEVHFSASVLVDVPMRVEFFRHLPGMFTGAGIVSTFAGILLGLTGFDPMVGPDQVTTQLKHLFVGVSTAFVASFFAIATAMVVTVVEKLLLQWRYSQVAQLQGRIDALFLGHGADHAGMGGWSDPRRLVDDLASAVREGMAEPLREIAQAVRSVVVEHRRQEERTLAVERMLSGMGDKLDVLVSGVNEGVVRVSHVMADQRKTLEESFNGLLALMEAGNRVEGQVADRLNQAVERGEAINHGVGRLQEEVARQSEKVAAWGEKAMAVLVGELTREMRDLAETSRRAQEAAGAERDAFLLSRMAASQGELSEHLRQTVESGLRGPVQEIVADLHTLREHQEQQGRALSEELLTAFAAHLRQTVGGLTEQLSQLGERIAAERQALEATVRNLLTGMAEVAREGGEKLGEKMEVALVGAEARQNAVLEALTRFSADMRVDLNLLEQQMVKGSLAVTQQVMDHTRELSSRGLQESEERIRASARQMTDELKEVLRVLSSEGSERERSYRAEVLGRMEVGTARLIEQVVESFRTVSEGQSGQESRLVEQMTRERESLGNQIRVVVEQFDHRLAERESERERVQSEREQAGQTQLAQLSSGVTEVLHRSSEVTNRIDVVMRKVDEGLESQENKVTQAMQSGLERLAGDLRQSFLEGMAATGQSVATELSATAEASRQDRKALADMLLLTMAEKMEQTFGGVASGLDDLTRNLQDDRDTIRDSLDRLMSDLRHVGEVGSEELAAQIRQVVDQAEAGHRGVMSAVQQVGKGLSSNLTRMQEGLMAKHLEASERLDQVQADIINKQEESARQVISEVDEVVSNVSQEQSRFIEMMIERVDALRQRLRIK